MPGNYVICLSNTDRDINPTAYGNILENISAAGRMVNNNLPGGIAPAQDIFNTVLRDLMDIKYPTVYTRVRAIFQQRSFKPYLMPTCRNAGS